ncbi:hypothetical protein ACSW29_14830 [Rhodococcus sp. GB-02]
MTVGILEAAAAHESVILGRASVDVEVSAMPLVVKVLKKGSANSITTMVSL